VPRGKAKARTEWRSEARARPELAAALVKLGRRVRELRLAQELTQEELARRSLLDPKHVQTIERGGSNVTVSTLLGLADALGCGVADLFHAR
jgi:transcriptional regulator with XRE-family HTH domain